VKTAPLALPSRIYALARPAARLLPCYRLRLNDAWTSPRRYAPLITPPFGGYWFASLTVNTKWYSGLLISCMSRFYSITP